MPGMDGLTLIGKLSESRSPGHHHHRSHRARPSRRSISAWPATFDRFPSRPRRSRARGACVRRIRVCFNSKTSPSPSARKPAGARHPAGRRSRSRRPVGPNGAGKTTLLKMLAGLTSPMASSRPNALTLGYLPQDGWPTAAAPSGRSEPCPRPPRSQGRNARAEGRLGDPQSEADHVRAARTASPGSLPLVGRRSRIKVARARGLGFEPDVQEQLTDHLSGG
jgi:hypothetical protein